MIPGYNHNIKYKERIFHVQTEDSGVKNPHLITLLYYGGNILESVKSSYADRVAQATAPDFAGSLSTLMQKQHKDVMRGLITGRYDVKIEQRSAGASFLNGPAPLNVAEGSQHQTSFGGGSGSSGAPKQVAAKLADPLTGATPPKVVEAAPTASPGSAVPAAPKVAWPASALPPAAKPAEVIAAAKAPAPVAATGAPPLAAQKPVAAGAASKGAFSTDGGSMLDAMAKAVPTLDADSLRDALEKGDDDYVFGDSDHKGLDAMMLDFLKR